MLNPVSTDVWALQFCLEELEKAKIVCIDTPEDAKELLLHRTEPYEAKIYIERIGHNVVGDDTYRFVLSTGDLKDPSVGYYIYKSCLFTLTEDYYNVLPESEAVRTYMYCKQQLERSGITKIDPPSKLSKPILVKNDITIHLKKVGQNNDKDVYRFKLTISADFVFHYTSSEFTLL